MKTTLYVNSDVFMDRRVNELQSSYCIVCQAFSPEYALCRNCREQWNLVLVPTIAETPKEQPMRDTTTAHTFLLETRATSTAVLRTEYDNPDMLVIRDFREDGEEPIWMTNLMEEANLNTTLRHDPQCDCR